MSKSPGFYPPVRLFPEAFHTARRRRTGFTLVEMLVVIAILAILAALLFPAISKALGKAQEADAQQDLRAIHAATVQYLTDHDGAFFSQFDYAGPGGAWGNLWVDKLQDYLPAQGVVSGTGGRNPVFYSVKVKQANRWIADYAPSDNLMSESDSQSPLSAVRLVTVRRPTQEVMFVEGANNSPPGKVPESSGAFNIWAKQLVMGNFTYPNTIARRHGGTGAEAFYVVFCDGHSARISFKEFSNDKDLRQTMFSANAGGNSIYR
ncbi:MAG: prepilin-type N-terminal cleavage/methylation domain-containing protein [Verrucomicrobiaceae bacterium]|nr:MAG: prepilin-type N-terminal cleavage/methylation domain-containing protein [Verrucomicrobiaceae bacterium]